MRPPRLFVAGLALTGLAIGAVVANAASLDVVPQKLTARTGTAVSIPIGQPPFALAASSPSVQVGTSVSVTATLSSPVASAPYGSVTFSHYAGAGCTAATSVTSSPVALTSPSVTSAPYTAVAGDTPTISWKAHYSGNADNASKDSNCVDVAVTTAALPSTKLHIAAIERISGGHSGNSDVYNAQVRVTVVDESANPVSGVTVSGAWSPAAPEATCSAATNAAGQCTFTGTFNGSSGTTSPRTWTISNLSKPGYIYISSANAVSKTTCTRSTENSGDTSCVSG